MRIIIYSHTINISNLMKKINALFQHQVANRIREIRKKKGMSLTDLQDKTDMDSSYIARIERFEHNISLNTLDKLIRGLDVTHAEFFSFLEIQNDEAELTRLIHELKLSPKKQEIIDTIGRILSISK